MLWVLVSYSVVVSDRLATVARRGSENVWFWSY